MGCSDFGENEGLNKNSHRRMGIKGQTEEILKRQSRQDLVPVLLVRVKRVKCRAHFLFGQLSTGIPFIHFKV